MNSGESNIGMTFSPETSRAKAFHRRQAHEAGDSPEFVMETNKAGNGFMKTQHGYFQGYNPPALFSKKQLVPALGNTKDKNGLYQKDTGRAIEIRER